MMSLISFRTDVSVGKKGSGFEVNFIKDEKYLVNHDMLNSLMNLYSKSIKTVKESLPLEEMKSTSIKNANRLLIVRSGGIGDILFILPYLSEIKKVNPKIKIDFSSFKANVPVVELGKKHLNNIILEPLNASIIDNYDRIILFNNFIENNKKAEDTNAFDIPKDFFDGIERGEFISTYKWTYPISKKIRIMIQFSSSTEIRDISALTWFEFIINLDPQRFEVIFVDSKFKEELIQQAIKEIRLRSKIDIKYFTSFDLKETLYLMLEDPNNKPHIFIGPDSGLTNIAGYHGLPTIGLYGPFPSHLRMKYYKNAIGIDVNSNCIHSTNDSGNCFQHGKGRCKLAIFRDEPYSPCLEQITYKHIQTAVKHILNNFYKNDTSI
jgi:ADP-heptose:LPS heptosyltransferase